MKTSLKIGLRLTLLCVVIFGGVYTTLVWGIAQLTPDGGRADTQLIAQKFSSDVYFWPRPSAVDYNAEASGGSNLGPTNPIWIQNVQERIDTILKYHPYLKTSDIPSEWVTASGSGLDPDLSVNAVMIQVKRIAKARKIDEKSLIEMANSQIEHKLFNFIGIDNINVNKLNKMLDNNYKFSNF